jgi:hypothetical protein
MLLRLLLLLNMAVWMTKSTYVSVVYTATCLTKNPLLDQFFVTVDGNVP